MKTIGQNIATFRKEKNITQEALAEICGVSSQAVSKWENDISLPDITLLIELSEILEVSVDELLGKKESNKVELVEESKRKSIDEMFLCINVLDGGNKVKVNLPLKLIKICVESGMEIPQISGNAAIASLDFKKIYELIESGLVGEIVSIEGEDGEKVSIVVE